MKIDVARTRRRLAQSWTLYGCALRPGPDLIRTVGHAARTRTSTALIATQMRYLLARPREPALPALLAQRLGALAPAPGDPVAWLVHHRTATERTIVFELDAHGRLASVVKLGRAADARLAHEATVLATLARSAPSREVVLPDVLGFEHTPSVCALRTRLDVTGLARPPYEWTDATLEAAKQAILSLRPRLAAFAPGALPTSPGTVGPAVADTPSHGDFTPWNLFLMTTGRSVSFAAIDFEQAGVWPEWWDPARLLMSALEEGRIKSRRIASAARILGVGSFAARSYVDAVLRDESPADVARRRPRLEAFVASLRG